VTGPNFRILSVATLLAVWAPGCADEAKHAKNEGKAPAAEHKDSATAKTAVAASPADTEQALKLCEHGVPAELCTKCNPDLIEVFKAQGDWCNSHGVPESQCKQCNPTLSFTAEAVKGPTEPICGEHGVPEAMCTKCKPQLVAKFVKAGDYCREHGLPRSVCPFCDPEGAKARGIKPPEFPPPGTLVKLARPELVKRAGLETQRAEAKSFAESLDVVGQLDFNQNRLAQLSARTEALVAEVKVDVGDEVKAGQPLVVLTSAGVGESQGKLSAAKARLEATRATLAREESLLARRISSQREVDAARAEVAAAQGEYDGASAGLRAAGAGTTGNGGRYTLVAPFAGIVISRNVVTGKTAEPGETLVEVADLTTLWAVLDVPEESATKVKPGQKVVLRFEGNGHSEMAATVSRVAANVDKVTRTVRVRVDVPNPERTLKAGLFIRARVDVGGDQEAVLLPRDALQHAEGHALVFVRTGEGVYEPMAVQFRPAPNTQVAILKGIAAGAEVVTTGAFLLKTEILKDSIGAGCADD
jgi:cobalt-zinc-cadmium efflux system membrane fusion protein